MKFADSKDCVLPFSDHLWGKWSDLVRKLANMVSIGVKDNGVMKYGNISAGCGLASYHAVNHAGREL
jgi:hypothetical protein